MKHKHYDLIVAWANGAKIQRRTGITAPLIAPDMNEIREHYRDDPTPTWGVLETYRINPEQKMDREVYSHVYGNFYVSSYEGLSIAQLILRPGVDNANIKYIFDGETGKLIKAEVLK